MRLLEEKVKIRTDELELAFRYLQNTESTGEQEKWLL